MLNKLELFYIFNTESVNYTTSFKRCHKNHCAELKQINAFKGENMLELEGWEWNNHVIR